eukprot:7388838-Prymnesium_polylepis.1
MSACADGWSRVFKRGAGTSLEACICLYVTHSAPRGLSRAFPRLTIERAILLRALLVCGAPRNPRCGVGSLYGFWVAGIC